MVFPIYMLMTMLDFLLGSSDLIVIGTDFERLCSGVNTMALVPSSLAFTICNTFDFYESSGFYLFYSGEGCLSAIALFDGGG